jgi:hypothetical protein
MIRKLETVIQTETNEIQNRVLITTTHVVKISLMSDVKTIIPKGKTQRRKLSEETNNRERGIILLLRIATRSNRAILLPAITMEEAEILLLRKETAAVAAATITQPDARGKHYEVI